MVRMDGIKSIARWRSKVSSAYMSGRSLNHWYAKGWQAQPAIFRKLVHDMQSAPPVLRSFRGDPDSRDSLPRFVGKAYGIPTSGFTNIWKGTAVYLGTQTFGNA
jgi:hypothetical protein